MEKETNKQKTPHEIEALQHGMNKFGFATPIFVVKSELAQIDPFKLLVCLCALMSYSMCIILKQIQASGGTSRNSTLCQHHCSQRILANLSTSHECVHRYVYKNISKFLWGIYDSN